MSNPSQSSSQLARRGKIALIPVLALILGAILRRPRDEPPATAGVALATSSENTQTPTGAPTGPSHSAVNWPRVDLSRIAAFSPFDPALRSRDEPRQTSEAADVDTTILDPEVDVPQPVARVDAIYEVAGQRVAVVEGRMVRVGDDLVQGRVVEITPSAVVLKLPPQPDGRLN